MPIAQGVGLGFTQTMADVSKSMSALLAPPAVMPPTYAGTTIQPPASASQIANSYSYNNSTSIGTIDACGANNQRRVYVPSSVLSLMRAPQPLVREDGWVANKCAWQWQRLSQP